MYLRGTLLLPDFKLGIFTKKMKASLEVFQKDALRVWLKAVLEKTPTYTGTVRGTYAPLGRVLRMYGEVRRGSNPVNKDARRKQQAGTDIQGRHYQLGFQNGSRYSDFTLSHKYTSTTLVYHFVFYNDLIYELWNDIQPGPTWMNLKEYTPWHAIKAGEEAWVSFVQTQLPLAMPKYGDYITFKQLKVN